MPVLNKKLVTLRYRASEEKFKGLAENLQKTADSKGTEQNVHK